MSMVYLIVLASLAACIVVGVVLASRLRYSIGSLLVVTAIIAMAVGLVVSMINNRRLAAVNQALQAENRRLRDEVGELSIDDPSRVHAIRVPSQNELEWRWRVWIPAGRPYHLRGDGERVPKDGLPSNVGGTITLEPGKEHLVRYVIRRDPRDNRWYGSLHGSASSVGKDEQPWVEWGTKTSTTEGVGTTTQSVPPNQPLLLARHRVSQSRSSTMIEDPAAGFLLWLEPVK